MLEKTRAWDTSRIHKANFAKPRILDCAPGDPAESSAAAEIENVGKLQMGYDGANLHLKWTVRADAIGTFKNGGDNFRRYFKTGAAVDIEMGTDPNADVDRNQPVVGDIRLLVTMAGGKPVAVLYRPVAPQAPKDQGWSTSTPAGGATSFDQVIVLQNAQVNVETTTDECRVRATVPLSELGLKIGNGMLLHMDWGVLSSRDGNTTSARRYWANPMAVGVTDEPTEARLQPNLWGFVRFSKSKDAFEAEGSEDIEDTLEKIMEVK